MLTEVADGVWVRQSEWVWSNTTVIRTGDGLVLVDPGITGAELDTLADEIEALGLPVVAGFSTHPHFDHMLWHPRLGNAPRYATATCATTAAETRAENQAAAVETAPDIPVDLVALVTPLPTDHPVPGELIEHQAHAPGHAAVLLPAQGVLIVGDMLSDILVPMLDPRSPNQLPAYHAALDALTKAAEQATTLIPGHGMIARADEIPARLAADRAYLHTLTEGPADDPRLLAHDWQAGIHETNLTQAS
ncbi:MBL fold metallo-hydrolase [Kribbella sp. NPDC051770]|uniref:MBL fold metallo-hydrolase n=1 Tax=Kribbella sp. NPDC051770 TaxID=3155413 RepID=UPI00341640FB